MGDTAQAIVDFNDTPRVITPVDKSGNAYTMTNPFPVSPGSAGSADGVTASQIFELLAAVFNGGGPALASGVPSGLAVDRLRSIQSKTPVSGTITATTAGDTSLVFNSAPKTILPGMWVKLSGAAGGAEYVLVASTYTPSAVATSIPLASPVVNSGQTTAVYEAFSTAGPGGGVMTPEGVLPFVQMNQDPATPGQFVAQHYGNSDSIGSSRFAEYMIGLFNGTFVDRWRSDQTGTGRVSLYGRAAAAGDTPVLLNAAGQAIVENSIFNATRAGNGYMASTGTGLKTATNTNLLVCGISLFNPGNSGKNLLVSSLLFTVTSATTGHYVTLTTSDPGNTTGFTNALVGYNAKGGGANSAASIWSSPNSIATAVTPVGNVVMSSGAGGNTPVELLPGNDVIYLPPGNGLALYLFVTTAGNSFNASAKWSEGAAV